MIHWVGVWMVFLGVWILWEHSFSFPVSLTLQGGGWGLYYWASGWHGVSGSFILAGTLWPNSVIVESVLFTRSLLRCSCCCQDFIKLLSALPSLSSLGHVTLSSSVWACYSCVQNPASCQILCNKEPATQASLIGLWAVACSMPDIPLGGNNGLLPPFLQTCSVLSYNHVLFPYILFLLLDSPPFYKSAHF